MLARLEALITVSRTSQRPVRVRYTPVGRVPDFKLYRNSANAGNMAWAPATRNPFCGRGVRTDRRNTTHHIIVVVPGALPDRGRGTDHSDET